MNIKVITTPEATYVLDWGQFVCQHDGDTRTETGEVDTFYGEHDTYEYQVTYCADCGEVIE